MAHPRHAEVRERYDGRCGYCGVGEADVGGDLTVDHYVPVSWGGDESDENLVYACFRCNLFKGGFVATAIDVANRHYILHPLRDDFREHVRPDTTTGRLEALSETGRFHIALLNLNRPALVAFRLRQRGGELFTIRRQLLEAENRELRAIIKAQAEYIARLKALLEKG